jgi:hypothetical protein
MEEAIAAMIERRPAVYKALALGERQRRSGHSAKTSSLSRSSASSGCWDA